MVCSELKDHGICSKLARGEACKYSHFLKRCDLCNVILEGPESFNAHYSSDRHITRSFDNGAGADGHCKICSLPYFATSGKAAQSSESDLKLKFAKHSRAKMHLKNVLGHPDIQRAPRHVLRITPRWATFCDVCQKDIHRNDFESHISGKRHAKAEQSRALQATVLKAKGELDIDLALNVLIDFGILDPIKQKSDHAIIIELSSDLDVRLVDIRMSSQSPGRIFPRQSHFIPGSWRGPIKYRESYGIRLTFDAKGVLGRFEDKVELVFKHGENDIEHIVVRDVLAVVGKKEELEDLAPVIPFKRLERYGLNDAKAIPGVPLPVTFKIKWAVKLKVYPIHEDVVAVLADSESNSVTQFWSFKNLLPPELNSETYAAHWSTILHAEEVQMAFDLSVYNMYHAPLVAKNMFYELRVPGLAEKRPSVLLGDKIKARASGTSGSWFEGVVHVVELETVLLRFNAKFPHINGTTYDIEFTLGRIPLRRMHQAIFSPFNEERILFPCEEHIKRTQPPTEELVNGFHVFNRALDSNYNQRLAVMAVMTHPPSSVPFVVFGPPGTGKTIVVIEAIRQLLDSDPNRSILACAPSNSAADLIAERLAHSGVGVSQLLRLNALSRSVHSLPDVLKSYSCIADGAFYIPSVADLKRRRVIIATCVTASVIHAIGVERGWFDYIFVDEAGQALEPEIMIPIKTLSDADTKIVLSGDPKQLGPIVHSSIAAGVGLARSYLERLTIKPLYDLSSQRGICIVKLTQNYRSHRAILKYPNDEFYNGELQECVDPSIAYSLARWDRLVKADFPIIFHAVTGKDEREGSSPSFFNPTEATIVKNYVQALREDQKLGLTDNDIGIISPYVAQCRKIRKALNAPELSRNRSGVIKVGSVELFQGQERRVIIISCVRSNKEFVQFDVKRSLGFVKEPKRFNVAMTRAQALLIVVGDPVILSLDPLWRGFLDYVHGHGGWTGSKKDWVTDGKTRNRDFMSERRADAGLGMDHLPASVRESALNPDEDDVDSAERGEQPWRDDE